MSEQEVIDELLTLDLPIGIWDEISRDKKEREAFLEEMVEKHGFYIAIMKGIMVNNVVKLAFFYNPDKNKSENIAGYFFHRMPDHYKPIEENVEFANWVFPYENMTIPLRY
ncbi:hypothetical protein ML462_07350 [Gramella lutea]|uniref:Uncharacterized protein n=1 Tax=Christiangramia lutea TaxID=1607951 RepID=A0A9X2AB15_9FLAO|nr:hypothetical protein [Christiangramia lutea]MCH4822987.1 hypothetical protein [Christiangramia lutea]